ncbi:hypothetical protein AGMMS49546_29270 [Spirochaetia bacterium]|nr:hypothetical protein AGMMS49546_29270 [Spirochaetia bacterium]
MKRLFILFCISFLFFSCKSADSAAKSWNDRFRVASPNFIADMDPVSVGSVSMQFEKIFSSSLEKKDVDVYFDPRIDSVYLQFRYQTVVYRQHWDKAGRLQFITALERYKKDYEGKNLKSKGNRGAYGSLQTEAEWGQLNYGIFMNSKSFPIVYLGYRFNKKSPYFTIYQTSAEDVIGKSDDSLRQSIDITTYYTRAQADELVKLFDQQYLLSFLGPRADPKYTAPLVEDDYKEADVD